MCSASIAKSVKGSVEYRYVYILILMCFSSRRIGDSIPNSDIESSLRTEHPDGQEDQFVIGYRF
jgi:hypothetical protein